MHLRDIKRRSEGGKNKRQRRSMMKLSVALMVLLHVCFSLSSNLNSELIRGLTDLNANYRVLPTPMHIPSPRMMKNARHCLGVFIEELRNIVNNMTVSEEHRSIVRGIQANLDHMGTPKKNQNCPMNTWKRQKRPFEQFIYFVKKLNSQP